MKKDLIKEFRNKFPPTLVKYWITEAVEEWIRDALKTERESTVVNCANEIGEVMAEFGDNPETCLSIIEERINLWEMTPEQAKIYNEGHDY